MGSNANTADRWLRLSPGALWFNAITTIIGAVGMLAVDDPLPDDFLDDTPFDSHLWPAIILLVVVGGASTVAIVARRRDWPQQWLLTVLAGGVLLGWLLVEFIWIPHGWAPQLFYAIVAALILVGGVRGWQRPG